MDGSYMMLVSYRRLVRYIMLGWYIMVVSLYNPGVLRGPGQVKCAGSEAS